MSGARVEITANTASPALAEAADALGEDAGLMLAHIGEHLLRTTRERGVRQVSPTGRPWLPLSPSYKRWKDKVRPGVPKLKFDFHMLGDQLSYQVVGRTLLVGTNAIYGAIHQFGGDPIPSRPWLGLSIEDEQAILDIAQDHLLGNATGD